MATPLCLIIRSHRLSPQKEQKKQKTKNTKNKNQRKRKKKKTSATRDMKKERNEKRGHGQHVCHYLSSEMTAERSTKYRSHVGIIEFPPVGMYGVDRPFYKH